MAIAMLALDGALLGLLILGGGRALANTVAPAGRMAGTVGFVLALVAGRTLLALPLAFESEVLNERRYGRGRPALRWLASYFWRSGVLVAALSLAALTIQVAAWWSPGMWWLWAAALVTAELVVAAMVVPIASACSAREVAPLRRRELASRLAALSARAGTGGLGIFEWKVGGRRPGATAMLVGLGASRRILVAGDVLDTHSDDEIEVIVAHEIAHLRRGDAWWSAALASAVLTLGFYLSSRLLTATAGALRIAGAGDLAGLPLVLLGSGAVAALAAPAFNAVSRAQERRADRDALRWTGNAAALVRTLKRLAAAHLAEDRPPLLAHVFFHRHPAVAERIAAAEKWTMAVPQTAARTPAGGREPTRVVEASAPLDSPVRSDMPARAAPDLRAAGRRAEAPPATRSR
jgi:STE24 endopeptidase